MPHIVDVIAELDHHQRIELADLYAANVITGIDVRVAKHRLVDANFRAYRLRDRIHGAQWYFKHERDYYDQYLDIIVRTFCPPVSDTATADVLHDTPRPAAQ
jgi:hypothetical protein